MKILTIGKYKLIAAAIIIVVLTCGGILWWRSTHRGPKMVYTSKGYGGYVPAPTKKALGKKEPPSPLSQATEAYNKGDYKKAEEQAMRVVESASGSKDLILISAKIIYCLLQRV